MPTYFSIGCIASYFSWTTLSYYIQTLINLSSYPQNQKNIWFDITRFVQAFPPPSVTWSQTPITFKFHKVPPNTRGNVTFPRAWSLLPATLEELYFLFLKVKTTIQLLETQCETAFPFIQCFEDVSFIMAPESEWNFLKMQKFIKLKIWKISVSG